MNPVLVISLLVFISVFGSVMALYVYMEEKYWRRVLARRFFGESSEAEAMLSGRQPFYVRAVHKMGEVTAPKDGEAVKEIQRMLSHAGFRDPSAVVIYFGIRAGTMLIFCALFLFCLMVSGKFSAKNALLAFLPMTAGYYLPALLLNVKIRSRQRRIFQELPDALDLVLICLEAGLSFDMALHRVSSEMIRIAPTLAGEFGQYFLEIQSGLPRKTVLNNLAERNGVDCLTSVVGVLTQSIRFGTNIAESLKVHIQSMRTRRRQMAEEQGGKMSTKLTFPMILLILPALFIIVLGPAVINIFERLRGGF